MARSLMACRMSRLVVFTCALAGCEPDLLEGFRDELPDLLSLPAPDGGSSDGSSADAAGPAPCRADAVCPRGRCDSGTCIPLPERTLAMGPVHCTWVAGMGDSLSL